MGSCSSHHVKYSLDSNSIFSYLDNISRLCQNNFNVTYTYLYTNNILCSHDFERNVGKIQATNLISQVWLNADYKGNITNEVPSSLAMFDWIFSKHEEIQNYVSSFILNSVPLIHN